MAVVGQGSAPGSLGCRFEVHVGSSLLVGYADVERPTRHPSHSGRPVPPSRPGSLAASASNGRSPSAAAWPQRVRRDARARPGPGPRPLLGLPLPDPRRRARGVATANTPAPHMALVARMVEALFRERRTVNPLMVPARYRFLYSSSRPSLRRHHTMVTGETASPITHGLVVRR